jgi:hypothetical protein
MPMPVEDDMEESDEVYGAPSHLYGAPSHLYGAPSHLYGVPSHEWRTKSYVSVMSDIISERTAELTRRPCPWRTTWRRATRYEHRVIGLGH